MEVNKVNVISTNRGSVQTNGTSKKGAKDNAEHKGTNGVEASAVLELGTSGQVPAVTYQKPQMVNAREGNDQKTSEIANANEGKTHEVNAEEINRLWEEANRATQHLRDLVKKLLESQGKTFADVLSGKEDLVVDEQTRAEAAEAISENGESGVQAVSDRIVSFAKAISNNNPEMYDKLMSAINEGFSQAEKILGGQLPEICKQTREEVNRKMEEWKNQNSGATVQ